MIFSTAPETTPDPIEQELPDVGAARNALAADGAPVLALCTLTRERFARLLAAPANAAFMERILDALTLAYARMARRHGHLGSDFHAYHNEGHILEICDGRIGRLLASAGSDALPLRGWCALLLFGAGHDLRQRESGPNFAGVGANERASAGEMLRILDACGLSRDREEGLHAALELMIAGSTFDARPESGFAHLTPADLVQAGGALAARLARSLDELRPGWREDARLVEGERLARIAADLDTANVAEPFAELAASGERLCLEREMLAGRSLAEPASALPVLSFLGAGQSRYFFELHAFHSRLGRAAFAEGKAANAPRMKALAFGMRARLAVAGPPANGEAVLAAYRATLASVLAVNRPAASLSSADAR